MIEKKKAARNTWRPELYKSVMVYQWSARSRETYALVAERKG